MNPQHYRSHTCGALNESHANQTVRLSGWVLRRRDHGGVIFVDLRDRSGIVQIVFRGEIDSEAHQKADRIRSEFVLQVEGKVDSLSRAVEELFAEKVRLASEINVLKADVKVNSYNNKFNNQICLIFQN